MLLIGLVVAAIALLGTSSEEDRADDWWEDEERVGGPSASELEAPQATGDAPALTDHWHAAFGVNVCGDWYPDLYDIAPDYSGIHTHEDGVIHIHPFSLGYTGSGANLGAFFEMVDIWVDDDGETVLIHSMDLAPRTGTCGDQSGRWVIARFQPDVSDQVAELIEDPSEFISVRFLADREAFTLAWLPEGEDVPMPPSVPMLDRLSDVPTYD